ncbi:hypothetical protein O6H91_Y176200 [Diphasiastrum complanatum]|nr:hypothetical protein O6H91_Y176200 [Diphasiastrum complanatum]
MHFETGFIFLHKGFILSKLVISSYFFHSLESSSYLLWSTYFIFELFESFFQRTPTVSSFGIFALRCLNLDASVLNIALEAHNKSLEDYILSQQDHPLFS